MPQPEVDICLSTFEGAAFVAEQVDSLLRQTHAALHIRVRDDGSRDGTLAVLRELAAGDPRIELHAASPGRLGPVASYSQLLATTSAPYVMLCDQDDVWDPDKVAVSLARLRALEAEHPPGTPLLVHSDLRVVGPALELRSPSFWRFQHLDPAAARSLPRLLMQNVVTGCTVLTNRPLLELALPIPQTALMHDWWLALHAAAFGAVAHLSRTTAAYRQHADNVAGAQHWTAAYVARKAARAFEREDLHDVLRRTGAQAQSFLERHHDRLSPEQRASVRACAELMTYGAVGRRVALLRHGLRKVGFARNVGLLLRV